MNLRYTVNSRSYSLSEEKIFTYICFNDNFPMGTLGNAELWGLDFEFSISYKIIINYPLGIKIA